MRVVILPGKNDEGGPPTYKEIEEIENRYQLQSEGKAEYYNFDRALSIRMKIQKGLSLEEQLRDDPNYVGKDKKEILKATEKINNELLEPLNCIDSYLQQLERPGLFNTVSTGPGDKEGRWQAFIDYYNSVKKILNDDKKRLNLNIEEDEVGEIEEIAFKIIRKRDFPNLPKVHMIMREFPKWIANQESKDQLYKLLDINFMLSQKEIVDKDGKEYSERDKDLIWGQTYASQIISTVKKARQLYENAKEQETPISLLEAALKKLEHKEMIPDTLRKEDLQIARNLASKIQKKANEIEKKIYELIKS